MGGISELVQTADRGAANSEVGLSDLLRVRSHASRNVGERAVMLPLKSSIPMCALMLEASVSRAG
jgi:hypothetical protein